MGDRLKIYLIITLSLVLVVSIYFRFIRGKIEHNHNAEISPLISSAVQQAFLGSSGKDSNGSVNELPGFDECMKSSVRDIFMPQVNQVVSEDHPSEEEPAETLPSFKLKGTISGGERPVAIINDRFVRKGDTIEGYKVIQIGKNMVLLASEKNMIELEMFKNE